jgi:PAS domain S-box-containing protein
MEEVTKVSFSQGLTHKKISLSKTDLKGVIEYANDYFIEASGFSRAEIMGKPHNIFRHPDMPKAAFKLMWDTIQKGKTFHAIVKNKTKSDGFYWVLGKVEPKKDEEGNIIAYFSQRKALPNPDIAEKVEKYYNILVDIEKENKIEVSEKYFLGLLEELGLTYDGFVLKMLNFTQEQLDNYFIDAKQINQEPSTTFYKNRPIPNNIETKIDPSQVIMSKTDLKGVIQYADDYFIRISEYNIDDIMGQPHNIIRHPDMPRLVFKLMWDKLKKGEGLFAIVKNLTKSGSFYWVLARIEPIYNVNNEIKAYVSYRKAAPPKAVERIENYYQILTSIEKKKNLETSENYFKDFLADNKLTYDQFILKVLGANEATLNQYFEGLVNSRTDMRNSQTIPEINVPEIKTTANTVVEEPTKQEFLNIELQLNPSITIKVRTNLKGNIEFANASFYDVTGYDEDFVIGENHNILRHPDMPKTIFKFLWDQLLLGNSFNTIVKNATKDGKFYWVMNHIHPIKNSENEIIGYKSFGKAIPEISAANFRKFYSIIKEIENIQGINASYNYLVNHLAEKKITYDEWLINMLDVKKEDIIKYFSDSDINLFKSSERKKSLVKKWFS